MIDIERLDRALAYIEAHPEQHNQGVWLSSPVPKVDCGTAACLAGWVMLQEYPEAVFEQDRYDHGPTYSKVREPYGEQMDVEATARKLLGLDHGQAGVLFAPENDLAALKRLRNVLATDPQASHEALVDAAESADDEDVE
jgi:hypothetical protein